MGDWEEEACSRTLRKLRKPLVRGMLVSSVLDQLISDNVISGQQEEFIVAQPTPSEKNTQLLRYLEGGGPRALESLISACHEDHPDLAQRLREERERQRADLMRRPGDSDMASDTVGDRFNLAPMQAVDDAQNPDDQPDMYEVRDYLISPLLATGGGCRWKDLGRHLSLGEDELRDLGGGPYRGDVRSLIRQVITLWLERHGARASLTGLENALREMGLNDTANSMMGRFGIL